METQIAPGQQFSETSSDPIPLGKSFSFHSTNRKEGKTSASYSLVVGGATGRGGGTPRSGGHSVQLDTRGAGTWTAFSETSSSCGIGWARLG